MPSINILVLGSGLVARPCVDYLVRNPENEVTVAAQALCADLPRTRPITLDVSSTADLDPQVAAHDLVISLVPYAFHPAVIKSAIKGKTNVVTTSYISPAMRDLDAAAKQSGIVVLNEVGLDPGVDHLYAIKTIDEVHRKGGKVKQFHSYCGGLPAPAHSANPLRFKFSWSPRGALLSQCNSATFLSDGHVVEIPANELMASAKPYPHIDGYSLVAYPNRDSLPFRTFYNIPEAETVVRGSLRYDGNPQLVRALAALGWLDAEQKEWLQQREDGDAGPTWAQVHQKAIGAASPDESALIERIKEVGDFPSEAEADRVVAGLRWFGLFSASERADVRGGNLLDTLAGRLEKLLSYAPGERDLVVLQHRFVVEWKDGGRDTVTSTLELLGDPDGYSAMALSVGVTCGVAAQLLLDGHPALSVPGVRAPYTKDVCDPIRELIEREGIKMVEKVL